MTTLESEMIEVAEQPILNAERARDLTRQIRVGLESTYSLIIDAFRGQAWTALGYPSWDTYCQGEFATLVLQPPREVRSHVINSLRDAGMSVRAISSAVDLSKDTVAREIRAAGVSNATAAMPTIGLDGKTYSTRQCTEKKFTDVPLDESLLDMDADELGIGLKEERKGPRVTEKPASIPFSAEGRMAVPAALGTTLLAVTESAKAAFDLNPQQDELFPIEHLFEASRSIALMTSIVADATFDVDVISDTDRETLRCGLQGAVDRLNHLLDRL